MNRRTPQLQDVLLRLGYEAEQLQGETAGHLFITREVSGAGIRGLVDGPLTALARMGIDGLTAHAVLDDYRIPLPGDGQPDLDDDLTYGLEVAVDKAGRRRYLLSMAVEALADRPHALTEEALLTGDVELPVGPVGLTGPTVTLASPDITYPPAPPATGRRLRRTSHRPPPAGHL